MKIHVVQREGTRYFSRFTDLADRDRLLVELQIEDKNGQSISIDLTEALIEEYSKHPQIGRVSTPSAVVEITSLQPIKPMRIKQSKTVSPAYLTDSPHADILSKVREAQIKAAGEKKRKQAELAAARAERLVAAREAKARKSKVKSQKSKVASPMEQSRVKSQKSKVTPSKATKVAPMKASKPVVKAKAMPRPASANPAGITQTQAQAIKKIGKVLAKEEQGQLTLGGAKGKAATSARNVASKPSVKAPAPTPKHSKAAVAGNATARKK